MSTPGSEGKKPSWHRKLSAPARPNLPTLPTLPNLSTINLPSANGLRQALLGYIGEVETTLRRRRGNGTVDQGLAGPSGESSKSSAVDAGIIGQESSWSSGSNAGHGNNGAEGFPGDAHAGPSSHSPLQGEHHVNHARDFGDTSPTSEEWHDADLELMDHLESLKEDVGVYLASGTSTGPSTSSRPMPKRTGTEWMRSLPSRLRQVEEYMAPLASNSDAPSRTNSLRGGHGHRHASPGTEEIQHDDPAYRALREARKRLIQFVKSGLPSDQWPGWEKLGWEEQSEDGREGSFDDDASRSRSPGGTLLVQVERPEEEEPEYIFPNRTPAAKRTNTSTRASRSQSFHVPSLQTLTSRPVKLRSMSSPGPMDIPVSLAVALSRDTDEVELLKSDDLDDAEETEDTGEILVLKELAAGYDPLQGEPTVKQALDKAQDGTVLIEYEDLPVVWRNNEHIITGYRFIPLHAKTGPIPLLKSAFAWHNETVNIHSHFIPTILFSIFIAAVLLSPPLPDAYPLDSATVVIYLLAAVACLISSASWHVLSGCASRKWFEWGACVDYIGIAWLIEASIFVITYNAFYCHPKTVAFYGIIDIICGTLGSVLPFQAWFNKRKNKKWRITFFLFLCFTFLGPLGQMVYLYGYGPSIGFIRPFFGSVVAYVVGLLCYGFHFPECLMPGKFDHLGHSHQLWHVAIVAAILLHYQGIFAAHGARHSLSCAIPDAGPPLGKFVEAWWRTLGQS
ncbi:hemolysin-III related-domain-containing protein [Kockovaella imperatae]|uniref:Hemolysin-III related-domain-containing protein n=1 Tax=Kockovaella imperatae TaxID=4999 RepID=A0A1Y1UCS4_9TREE|nr:hemolysin-III related-domain-containing protein [Kockovaella imperatae]ORX35324.1 hemolysin-III related-domain-containing protein [Kockovaella imperatae]